MSATGLPHLDITILNNQLGSVVPTDDHVYGLVLSGVAASGLAISTPAQIFDLKSAVALGITAAYDTTNTTEVYKQIKDFYQRAGSGIELWIMIIPKTTTLTTACDVANDIVKKLINASSGRITLWGINRVPDGGYTPTTVDGIDDDVSTAVVKAQELCEAFATQDKPCRAIIGARAFTGTASALKDFRTGTANRVGVVLGSIVSTGNPAVGFTLGQFANRPIQRKISRVKDGDVGILTAYMSNGAISTTQESFWDSIANKGYIFFRKFVRKANYYFSSDPTCAPLSDDYAWMARGLVIDKLHRVVYNTYIEELDDDLEVDEDGYPDPTVIKNFKQKVVTAISATLGADGNISGEIVVDINPVQNIIATNVFVIDRVAVLPKGYSSYISVSVGFYNPLNEVA